MQAGDELVLAAGSSDSLADTDGASTSAYDALVAAARSGSVTPRTLKAAYVSVLDAQEEPLASQPRWC